jgi:hypothetical protein
MGTRFSHLLCGNAGSWNNGARCTTLVKVIYLGVYNLWLDSASRAGPPAAACRLLPTRCRHLPPAADTLPPPAATCSLLPTRFSHLQPPPAACYRHAAGQASYHFCTLRIFAFKQAAACNRLSACLLTISAYHPSNLQLQSSNQSNLLASQFCIQAS